MYFVPDFSLTMISGVIRLLFWPVMFVRGGGREGKRGRGRERGRIVLENGKDMKMEGKREREAGMKAGRQAWWYRLV